MKVESADRFSYRQKGGQVRQKSLRPITQEVLSESAMLKCQPFRGIAKSTVQGAIGRLTKELEGRSKIRHAYSCHDFRHFYAIDLYHETQDVYALKEALGHATVSVTEIYLAGLGALREAPDENPTGKNTSKAPKRTLMAVSEASEGPTASV